jgi:hypothetical protein
LFFQRSRKHPERTHLTACGCRQKPSQLLKKRSAGDREKKEPTQEALKERSVIMMNHDES